MKQLVYQKPSFVYVGRLPCECCVALVNDDGNKFTARSVAEFISEGLAVNREPWEKYANEIINEPTFMKCPHGKEQTQDAQLPLFEAA